jgi:hypothetical protein
MQTSNIPSISIILFLPYLYNTYITIADLSKDFFDPDNIPSTHSKLLLLIASVKK